MTSDTLNSILHNDFPAARSGDRAAFARLVQATQRMVASIALAVTRDVAASEDIAQETFLSAWQRLESMREPESLLPWLRQVARNRAIDVVRRRRHTELSVDSEDQRIASAADTAATPAEQLEHAQQQALLMQALEQVGLRFSGMSPDGELPEIVELPDHPWFIGVQFHPELKSKPFEPHPLFTSFVRAAVEQSRLM